MNSNKNNLAFAVKGVLYLLIVVLTIIAFAGQKAGLMLNLGYILMIAAIAMVLLFAVLNMIDEPKKSIKSLVGLAAIVVLFLITYSTASDTSLSNEVVTATYTKFVGGSLTMLYIVGSIAVLSIIVSEIYSLIK